MKHKISLLLATLAMLSLTACMKEYPTPTEANKEINVKASIEELFGQDKPTSRAIGNSWESGDAIGIFMINNGSTLSLPALAANAKYMTNGTNTFTPTLGNTVNFPINKSKVDFIAYYPYTTSLNGLDYQIDISDQSNFSDIDLLYSNNVKGVNSSSGSVDLKFQHQLVKIVLNISMDETVIDFTELQASITNVNTKANFSLIDGTINNETMPKSVLFNINTDGTTGSAILLPTNDISDKSLIISLDTTSYFFDLSKTVEIKSFDKSTAYVFNVTLKPGENTLLKVESSSIEKWITGASEDIIAKTNTTEDSPNVPEEEEEEGDGTEEKPYNITQALIKIYEKNVWVTGYIVGFYNTYSINSFVYGIQGARIGNTSLALSPDEIDYNKTFPIELIGVAKNVASRINLYDSPDMFKEQITIYGDIDYFNKPNGDAKGLKNVSKAIINGVTYK